MSYNLDTLKYYAKGDADIVASMESHPERGYTKQEIATAKLFAFHSKRRLTEALESLN